MEFIRVWPRSSEVSQGLQMFTSESYVCYVGFGPADSSPNNWCKSPEDGKDTHTYTLLNWLKNPNINIILLYHNSYKLLVLQFFQILHKTFSQNAVASSCRRSLCPALSLSWYKTLQSSPAFKGDLCCESSTAAVTLLCRADARLLNLSDSLTNPLQSLKSQPSNAPWQGGTQMFCAVYFRPEFITQNPDVSAHLSLVDVTEGTEVKEEIVVGERHLCVGYAAVVTCRGQRSIWLCVCVCQGRLSYGLLAQTNSIFNLK